MCQTCNLFLLINSRYMDAVEHSTHIKDKPLPFVLTLMKLEVKVLSEISQTLKDKHSGILLTWGREATRGWEQ